VIWAVRAGFAAAIVTLLLLAVFPYVRPPADPSGTVAAREATPAMAATPPAASTTVAQTLTPAPTATSQTIVSRMARTTPTLLPRPTAAPNEPPSVTISDAGFAPAELRIAVGMTVVWRNVGLQSHDVSMIGRDQAVWGSGLLAPNAGTSRTFSAPGQYDYTCSLHTVMRGRVVVEP
jgi:plastocyanin